MCTACKNDPVAAPARVLRTTAPRSAARMLERPRLSLNAEPLRTHAVTLVQAPQGFGKTSLLQQWRREHMARGDAVAWLCADRDDGPRHFVQGLLLAVRTACRRPEFCSHLADSGMALGDERLLITTWCALVAQLPFNLVLIIDEAERLGTETRQALLHLLHHVPPNLRVVVACRSGLADAVADLTAYGECVAVDAEDLRFQFDETVSLARGRFPGHVDLDACARLHDLTEGWPLGLQMALSALDRPGHAHATLDGIVARLSNGPQSPIDAVLAKLSGKDLYFLTCISVLEVFHPDLARAVTNRVDAVECLSGLVDELPIFANAHDKGWLRLNHLARTALLRRLADFSADERVELHRRAMRWLIDRGLLRAAAHHAFHAGQNDIAHRLLEHSLYEAVMQGQWTIALDWLGVLPQDALDRLPRLRMAAAVGLALTHEQRKAEDLIGRILEQPGTSRALRYECALILSLGAYAADDPDRFVEIMQPWADSPPVQDARLLQSHANRLGILDLLAGEPALARHHQEAVPNAGLASLSDDSPGTGGLVGGLSYLSEGQVRLAEELVRPTVASADAKFGRDHPFACVFATMLACALYEQGKLAQASAVLAGRLDALKRAGTAESVLMGYCTAALLASAQGLEHRAIDLLEVLASIGLARRLPRLSIVALGMQMRLHAARFRNESCMALMQRIDTLLARDDLPKGPLWRRSAEVSVHLARAYRDIAAQHWQPALEHLDRVTALAKAMRLGRVQVEALGLRALALERNGGHGWPQFEEAMTLAQVYGLERVLADAHPVLGEWARQRVHVETSAERQIQPWTSPATSIRLRSERAASTPRAAPCSVLTPKERQVLELLARNLSTKKIAAAMDVSDTTAKWHIKNLFGKLDAGTRQHVVHRARSLGLLLVAD